jgi:hypothetical protein
LISLFLALFLQQELIAFQQSTQQPGSGSRVAAEDWNSLSLETSHLHAFPPIIGEKDERSDFTRELVRVQWRENDPIYLYVIMPKGLERPPAILYLYSYPSELDRFRNDALCRLFIKGGVAAIGFVSALTGHRYHDRPMREWFVSELQESLVTSVHDVQMILNYLTTRDDLDPDRIGMFGEGSGGTIAVLTSAIDARLKAIDLFAPWCDWRDWLALSPIVPDDERAIYRRLDFVRRVASFDPVEWLTRVKAIAIRLQYTPNQWGTPKIAQDRITSAAPARAQIRSYTYGQAESGTSISLFDWIKEQLSLISEHRSSVGLTRAGSPR